MNRRQLSHVGVLVLAGLAVRLWLFMDVGVNGDTGLYLYDAKQLLWGHRMFVEFPSRSPVFEYALAGVLSLGYSPILSARAFMLTVGLALGVAIYAFARHLHSHRAGFAAMALFYLTPFPAVWGLWVKTEQAAGLLVLIAFVIALTVVDRDRLPVWAIAAVGMLFGTAFLIRRSAIVHMGAFAIFILWYRLRHVREWRSTLAGAVGVLAVAGVVLLAVYAGLAGFDPGVTQEVGEWHAVALFASDGEGSLGWIEHTEPKAITAEDRNTLLAQVCQKCGGNTVGVFIVTILVAFPALLPLLIFLRSFLEPAGFAGDVVLPVTFTVAGLWGLSLVAYKAVLGIHFFWSRALAVFVFIGAMLYLWRLKPIPFDRIWRPKLALPILVLLSLTAGYLYRDRIIYVTYFQDFYPYIVTLAAISAVEFFDTDFGVDRRRTILAGAAILLALSLVVGAGNAYPYNPDNGEDQRAWFSIDLVRTYGADIEARTEPGDKVLAAQPLYVIEADRRLAGDLSRRYYLFRGWPHTDLAEREEQRIISEVKSGRVTHVVYDSELQAVYNSTDDLASAVDCRFTPTAEQHMYNRTDAVLLERKPNANDCDS